MPIWLALLGVVVLGGVGVYTATHPNGGYRAVGGVGPDSTRQLVELLESRS